MLCFNGFLSPSLTNGYCLKYKIFFYLETPKLESYITNKDIETLNTFCFHIFPQYCAEVLSQHLISLIF